MSGDLSSDRLVQKQARYPQSHAATPIQWVVIHYFSSVAVFEYCFMVLLYILIQTLTLTDLKQPTLAAKPAWAPTLAVSAVGKPAWAPTLARKSEVLRCHVI